MAKRKTKREQYEQYAAIITGKREVKTQRTKPLFGGGGGCSETEVYQQIKRVFKKLGGYCIRVEPGPLYSTRGVIVQNLPKGTPDIIGCIPGEGKQIFIAVEAKAGKGGTLSEEQVKMRDWCANRDIAFFVCHSGSELEHYLEREGLLVTDSLFR